MTRDIEKTAEKARENKPEHYDLTYQELRDLLEKARGDIGKAIITAFNYGFVLGHRATAAGKVKKRL